MKKEYVYIQKYVSKANPLYLILPAFVFLSLILKRLSGINTSFLKGNTFTLIIALAALIYIILEIKTKKMLKELDKVITIEDGVLSFFSVENFKKVCHKIKLSDISYYSYIEGGSEFKIKTKDSHSYKFFGEFFENKESFLLFMDFIKNNSAENSI